jgi:hypothetical protein
MIAPFVSLFITALWCIAVGTFWYSGENDKAGLAFCTLVAYAYITYRLFDDALNQ